MPRVFRHYGRIVRRAVPHISGGSIEENEIQEETPQHTEFKTGISVQKPLQQMYGQHIKGLNIRANNNVIKPFGAQPRPSKVPLSATSINPQNSSVIAHLGKPIGASRSLVKNVSLIQGNGLLQGKNNIRLVL